MDCPTATIEWILWVDVPHPSQVKQALFQKSKGREWGWPDANKSLVGLRLPDVSQDLDVSERERSVSTYPTYCLIGSCGGVMGA